MVKDLVSIIIPCYNSEKYIRDCLEAILRQTYKKLEIIAINDGSTDNTLEILKSYEQKFFALGMKYIILSQENLGQSAAVNNGLKYITGEFFTWQDSDDCYTKDSIELRVNYLKTHKEMDLVRGEVLKYDEKMENIIVHEKSKYPEKTNIFELYFFETDSYCWAGIFMIKMEHFDKCVKDRTISVLAPSQNSQLIFPTTYNSKCGYISNVVYKIRVRKSSYYFSSTKTIDAFLRRLFFLEKLWIENINRIEMSETERSHYMREAIKFYKKKREPLYLEKWFNDSLTFKKLNDFFEKNKIKEIALYGMGKWGKKLYDILRESNVVVKFVVDKNAENMSIEGLKIIEFDEEIESVDCIIITAVNYYEEIKNILKKDNKNKFITLNEIVKKTI